MLNKIANAIWWSLFLAVIAICSATCLAKEFYEKHIKR